MCINKCLLYQEVNDKCYGQKFCNAKEKRSGAPLFQMGSPGHCLAVQWLVLHASPAGGTGSIPGGGTKIPHAGWCGQKKKKRGCQATVKVEMYEGKDERFRDLRNTT